MLDLNPSDKEIKPVREKQLGWVFVAVDGQNADIIICWIMKVESIVKTILSIHNRAIIEYD